MKVISEINHTVEYEAWTGSFERMEQLEKAVELLKNVFPEMKAKLIIQSHSFVEHGYDLKLKIKITGGKE